MAHNEKCGTDWQICPKAIEHQTEINELKRRMSAYEEAVAAFVGEVRELKETLLNRPTWFTSLLITTLTGFLVTAVMYIVTHL